MICGNDLSFERKGGDELIFEGLEVGDHFSCGVISVFWVFLKCALNDVSDGGFKDPFRDRNGMFRSGEFKECVSIFRQRG